MNWSEYKFHPSSLGLIMTDSRTKEPLGETCKDHLMECYVRETYGREKDITNKYIEKGLLAEEDSITLYSMVTKQFYLKNKEQISNDWFIGTPDLFTGRSIKDADLVIDLKTSWDIFTFFQTLTKPIKKAYFWQLQAYMDLTGAKEAKLVYCLVNTPYHLIEDEKKKVLWKLGVIDQEHDERYLKACEMIDRNCIFDDIPEEKRYIEFTIDRDNEAIEKAKVRVAECREFLNQMK